MDVPTCSKNLDFESVKEDPEEIDLVELFMQLQHENGYNIKCLIKDNNKVYCTLCNCDICGVIADLTEVVSKIHFHMTGIHLENILKQIKSVLKCSGETELLEIKDQGLICNLCTFEIEVEDIKQTLAYIRDHLDSRKHIRNLQNIFDFSKLSEQQLLNRYYIFMNMDGRYFCQLCSCLINNSNQCMLHHIASLSHLKYMNNKNQLAGKECSLIVENISACSTKFQISSVSEYLPRTFQGEINKDYEKLKKQFQESLPQIVRKNKYFIVKDGKYFKCNACSEVFITLDLSSLKKTLKEHFKSLRHKNLIRGYLGLPPTELKGSKVVEDNLLQPINSAKFKKVKHVLSECSADLADHTTHSNFLLKGAFNDSIQSLIYETTAVHCKYPEIRNITDVKQTNTPNSNVNEAYEGFKTQFKYPLPTIIEKNKNFITKFGKHYKCTLCDVVLAYSHDFTKLKSTFKMHFGSLNHKNATREYLGLPLIEIRNKKGTLGNGKLITRNKRR